MKNRRVALLMLGCLTLVGCTSAPAEPSPSPTLSAEELFLDEMRETEAFFGFPDEQLVTIGGTICDALRDGSTFDDVVALLAMNDYDKEDASTIIFLSSKAYCPEQDSGSQ